MPTATGGLENRSHRFWVPRMIVTLPAQFYELRPSPRLFCKWSARITSLEFYNKNLINTQPKNIYGSPICPWAPSRGARCAQQQTSGEKHAFLFPGLSLPRILFHLRVAIPYLCFLGKTQAYEELCLLMYNPVYFTNSFFFSCIFYPFSLGVCLYEWLNFKHLLNQYLIHIRCISNTQHFQVSFFHRIFTTFYNIMYTFKYTQSKQYSKLNTPFSNCKNYHTAYFSYTTKTGLFKTKSQIS